MNQEIKKQLTTTGVTDSRAIVRPGFDSERGFELLKGMAKAMTYSKLVPAEYQGGSAEAIANCCHAISMAARLGLEPVTVAQNLHTISGQSVWSAKFRVAAINSCGIWEPPLRYRFERDTEPKSVEYTVYEWSDTERRKVPTKKQKVITNVKCWAYAVNRRTGEIDEGPMVSYELAIKEGWWDRTGSKWPTMPQTMLMKRAASQFGDAYAPHVTMGLGTVDDAIDVEFSAYDEFGADNDEPVPTVERVEVSNVSPAEIESEPGHVAEIEPPKPPPRKRRTNKKSQQQETESTMRNFDANFEHPTPGKMADRPQQPVEAPRAEIESPQDSTSEFGFE